MTHPPGDNDINDIDDDNDGDDDGDDDDDDDSDFFIFLLNYTHFTKNDLLCKWFITYYALS